MKKVALTGGPAGGKSTALRHLQSRHGEVLVATPEAATILLSGGFPTPTDDHPRTAEWQTQFQTSIAVVQIALEQITEQRAKQDNKNLMICDRGLADGAAYLTGGLSELAKAIGHTQEEILGRYSLVVHLPTSAAQAIGYQKHTNIHRLEESEEALALETKTLEAWKNHPNRKIVNIEDSAQRNELIAKIILEHIQK